ncbi:uncharacterized protein EI97DRAFT_453285 [Westerdykella ornata]|uniref:Rhodopsin domain-containing protein n=1 Tax=Westerdykella ornata TaxID=318751 RepID=A0A6A6J687_WESOR|nr:uncharacterized protein EI97DRAFT_453285 [Westerdykella ornata]KAF2272091.1 hypothetical protein EI97DRAFT_453285 [Westerdykella ornata]
MSIVTIAVHSGSGRHVAALTIPQAERALLFTTISFIPGILSYTLPKFAVVILIKDLLRPSRRHEIAIWALAGVNVVLIVLCITFVYVQCDPPRVLWTIGLTARCWDPVVLIATSIAGAASSALFDFWLALYPAAVLWRMPINLRKKIAMSTALGFGVCAGSVAVYKATTFVGDWSDFTYAAVNLVIWTSIEANSVIISACIPMLLPLVELIFGKNFLSSAKPRLRAIQTSSELENNPSNVELGTEAGATEREDWQQQFQGAGMFSEDSAHGSERSGKSDV